MSSSNEKRELADISEVPYLGTDDVPFLGPDRDAAESEAEQPKALKPDLFGLGLLGSLFKKESYGPGKDYVKGQKTVKAMGKAIGKALNPLRPAEDPSARAMFQSMGFAGGVTRTALEDIIRRASGGEGVSSEEWKKVRGGEATPSSTKLQKEFGMNPKLALILGYATDAMTDPMNAFFAGTTAVRPTPSLRQAALQTVVQPVSPLTPIASGLRAVGKRAFRAPFAKVDAGLVKKYPDMAARGQHPFSDILWNEQPGRAPEPLVGGFDSDPITIAEQSRRVRQQVGRRIGDTLKEAGGDSIDLAPDLAKNIDEHIMTLPPEQMQAAAKMTPGDWLKQQLAGDKNQRKVACEVCGGIEKIEVHHIIPFHVAPELELVGSNLITLCERKKYGVNCHLFFGHLGNYARRYNLNVKEDVVTWRERIVPPAGK